MGWAWDFPDKEFVRTCETCARAKFAHHHPYGLLQPLPNPIRLWISISIEFITDLPEINGFNYILVVVDRFTKLGHFIPCAKAISRVETTNLLLDKHTTPLQIAGCDYLRSRATIHINLLKTSFPNTWNFDEALDGISSRDGQANKASKLDSRTIPSVYD